MARKRRGLARTGAAITGASEEQTDADGDTTPACSTQDCPHPTMFRPLVQDFLCDGCYVEKFPATAFTEEAEGALDDESDGNGNLLSSFRGQFASARMMASDALADRQKRRAEEEERECHMCLDPGVLRRCCNKHYCHHCYFIRNGPACPGCGCSTHTTGIGRRSNEIPSDPGRLAVAITYVLTALVALAIAAGVAASFVNCKMAPATLYGQRCRGWMPRCELDVCIDASSVEDTAFSVPFEYRSCTIASTTAKIVGKACAFDPELFDRTGGADGFDLCLPPTLAREEIDDDTGDTSDPSPFFTGSKVLFEDDFDHWIGDRLEDGIQLASAAWATDLPMHARVSDVCGASNATRPYAFADDEQGSPSAPPGALSFTGLHHRSASTADLSLPLGGHVEFSLIMGPLRYDESIPESSCKPAYDANLLLDFSTNGGQTWGTIGTYTPYKYRGPANDYTFVRQEIPPNAWTNATRFRWSQPTFDPLGEYAAIDNVRIVANSLQEGWKDSEEYLRAKNIRDDSIRAQQCCLDTEQCNAVMQTSCPSIQSDAAGKRGIHTAEAFVFITAAVATTTKLYQLIAARLAVRNKPLDTNVANRMSRVMPAGNVATLERPFPVKSFRLARQLWWQVLNACLLLSPILALVGFDLHWLSLGRFSGRDSILFAIAAALDSQVVARLLIRTFQVSCRGRNAFKVVVSTDPETGYLKYGGNRIPILDLLNIQVLSTPYVWVLYLLHLGGGFPFALACYSSRYFGMGLAGHRIFVRTVGACAIARAIMRETFLVRLLMTFEWLLNFSRLKRDEMGRALRRGGVVCVALYIALACTALSLLFIQVNGDRVKDSHGRLVLWLGICGGIALGLVGAMIRGLPTMPHLYFASAPVGVGHAVLYERNVRCPCVYACISCADVNSRQVLFFAHLEDSNNLDFLRMLRGGGGESEN